MDYSKLIKMAFDVQKNSYSPYSNYKVGCAMLTKSGEVFVGTNVENATYNSTCAELSALSAAIAKNQRDIVAAAVVGGDGNSFTLPCGRCRQVLYEFNADMKIISATKDGRIDVKILKDLLPFAFDNVSKK